MTELPYIKLYRCPKCGRYRVRAVYSGKRLACFSVDCDWAEKESEETMTKTGKKKLLTEEATFEVELPKKYNTVEKFVKSKDYLMMVSQMSRTVRQDFFDHFKGCEKFEITDKTCIGGRCFIAITFWYEDWIDKIEVTDASKIGEKSDE